MELGCLDTLQVLNRPAELFLYVKLLSEVFDGNVAVVANAAQLGEEVRRGTFVLHSNRDLGATLASGSHRCDSMVIVPCSMKTLAGVAHGLSASLIERAADVMLKEKRRLVLVPRETPMSLPDLRNMVACAEAGAMILPAMPAFYQQPATIDDLAAFIAGKILNALGFDQQLFPPWKGE